jgi:hypothetical protein
LDPVIGTPGTIPDKVGVLLSTAATSVPASAATATTPTATASGEAPAALKVSATSRATASREVAAATSTATASGIAATGSASSATQVPAGRAGHAGPIELATRTLVATRKAAVRAKATGVKPREISLVRAQGVAHRPIHHEGLVGTLRGHLRREFSRDLGLSGEIRTGVGLLIILPRGANRRWCGRNGAGRQLEREIEVGGRGGDLHFAAHMVEPEHIGFDDPCAGRHSVKAEHTIIIGERDQASFALSRAHRCAGNRLATRLDGSGLRKCYWQAHCQKRENFEH